MKTAILLCAPDVPPSEIKILRKNLHKVLDKKGKKAKFLVVNYDVSVTALNPSCK